VKRLAVTVLPLALSGCVGLSFVSSDEGLNLQHPGNQHKRTDYLFPDYKSQDDSDPGNRVVLKSGIEISTDCYSEKLLTFMPSIIVPLPPVIPLFLSGPKWPGRLAVLIKAPGPIENVTLQVDGGQLLPVESKPGAYSFAVACENLKGHPATLRFAHGGTTEITLLIYKKTRNFGWAWLGGR
jgi:hypothetical protein